MFLLFHPVFSQEIDSQGLKDFYDSCLGVELMTDRAFHVKNLTIEEDSINVNLENGTLFFSDNLNNGFYVVVYVGAGQVSVDVPDVWHHYLKERLIDENKSKAEGLFQGRKFTNGFFFLPEDYLHKIQTPEGFFADEVVIVSLDAETKIDSKIVEKAKSIFNERRGPDDDRRYPLISMLKNRFNKNYNLQPIWMEFDTNEFGWIYYHYEPENEEEISLVRLERKTSGGARDWDGNQLAVFQCSEDQKKTLGEQLLEDKSELDVTSYNINLFMEKGSGKKLQVNTKLGFKPVQDGERIVTFFLSKENYFEEQIIFIDEIKDETGKSLEYIHDKNGQLTIDMGKYLEKEREYTLSFNYNADVVRDIGVINLLDQDGMPIPASKLMGLEFLPSGPEAWDFAGMWLPVKDIMHDFYTYEAKVKLPENIIHLHTGETLEEKVEDGYRIIHTKEEKPISFPFMIFGKYKTLTDYSADGDTKINIYSLYKQANQLKQILPEAKKIMEWYESSDVLDKQYPFKELDIAQMTFFRGFGQAPAGIVRLTGEVYLKPSEVSRVSSYGNPGKYRDHFLPHEIAHEWWGHTVGSRSDHDYWFIETLTEYTAGMYLQWREGPDRMREKIEDWRDTYFEVKEQHDEPMYLYDAAYSGMQLIYYKGPAFMHMIRMIVGNEVFLNTYRSMLKKFEFSLMTSTQLFDEFKEQTAKRLTDLSSKYKSFAEMPVEEQKEFAKLKTFYDDYDNFVNDWYMKAGYADVEFSYNVAPDGQGSRVTVNIRQDPSKFKRLFAPVWLHKKKQESVMVERWVDKPDFSFSVKLPWVPDNATFDDYLSTLSKVKYVK